MEYSHTSEVYLERVVRDRSKTVTSVASRKTLGSADVNLIQEQELTFKIECSWRNKSLYNSKIAENKKQTVLETLCINKTTGFSSIKEPSRRSKIQTQLHN
jgi:ribosome biogenesis protein Tsr3